MKVETVTWHLELLVTLKQQAEEGNYWLRWLIMINNGKLVFYYMIKTQEIHGFFLELPFLLGKVNWSLQLPSKYRTTKDSALAEIKDWITPPAKELQWVNVLTVNYGHVTSHRLRIIATSISHYACINQQFPTVLFESIGNNDLIIYLIDHQTTRSHIWYF
jgi:hypothetical protein